MNPVRLPDGFSWQRLAKNHPRAAFTTGQSAVDHWLHTKALQNQEKHLSVTTVLVSDDDSIVGFYSLAMGQVDGRELPHSIARKLPHRLLPVAVLAWLGVAASHHGKGFGTILLAQSLRDCYEASRIFPFVAVILDALDDRSKAFYQRFDFTELLGHPNRLFLPMSQLMTLMTSSK